MDVTDADGIRSGRMIHILGILRANSTAGSQPIQAAAPAVVVENAQHVQRDLENNPTDVQIQGLMMQQTVLRPDNLR